MRRVSAQGARHLKEETVDDKNSNNSYNCSKSSLWTSKPSARCSNHNPRPAYGLQNQHAVRMGECSEAHMCWNESVEATDAGSTARLTASNGGSYDQSEQHTH